MISRRVLSIFLMVLIVGCQNKKNRTLKKWSPEYKNRVKTTMMKSLSLDKDYSPEQIKKLCDCFVDKYEEFYPGGIKPAIPVDTL